MNPRGFAIAVLIGVALWAGGGAIVINALAGETVRDAALQFARYEVAVFRHL
jgi:hypothetical protein